MVTILNLLVLLALAGHAFYLFANVLYTRILFIKLGQKSEFEPNLKERINTLLVNVLGQRKLFKDKKSGFMHFVLFYGFFIIQIGLIELILKGFIKGYELVPFPYKLGTYTEMMVRQTVDVAKRRNKPIPIYDSFIVTK